MITKVLNILVSSLWSARMAEERLDSVGLKIESIAMIIN